MTMTTTASSVQEATVVIQRTEILTVLRPQAPVADAGGAGAAAEGAVLVVAGAEAVVEVAAAQSATPAAARIASTLMMAQGELEGAAG